MKRNKFPLATVVIILSLLCFSKANFAQDTLVKKGNGIIICKVIEIGLTEIKYKDWNNLNGPDIVISKSDLINIKFQNGAKMIIAPDDLSLELDPRVVERINNIKFAFFAPLFNHLCFGYETVLKPRTNIEAKIGIVGVGYHPGYSDVEKIFGGYLQTALKFYLGEDFYTRGLKRTHQLKGKYFKCELSLVTYNDEHKSYTYSGYTPSTYVIKKTTVYSGALNIIYGRQYILGDRFSFEYYIGAGIGVRDNNNSSQNDLFDYTNCYAYDYFSRSFPLTLTGGVTLGYIFK